MALLSQIRLLDDGVPGSCLFPHFLRILRVVATHQHRHGHTIFSIGMRIVRTTSPDSVGVSHGVRLFSHIQTMRGEIFLKRFPSGAWLVY